MKILRKIWNFLFCPWANLELNIRGKYIREYFRKIAEGEITEKDMVEDYEACLEDLRSRLSAADGSAVSRENAAWLGYQFMNDMR